jgi:hypothetical protein
MTLLAAAAFLLVGGALAGSGVLRLPSVVPPSPAPSFGLAATASPDATSPGPSDLAGPSASPIPAAGPGGAWIAVGTMGTPRSEHAAVRLLDGRVLVVGGHDRGAYRGGASPDESNPATAELYDPASGTWSATGNMLKRQAGFPPTLLLDGRVLVGDVDDPDPAIEDDEIAGSEVFDPASGTWSSAGNRPTGGTATLLRDGKVLVAGLGGAQLYDPDSGTWSATGTMITPRGYHTATLLRDGRVLVAGGDDGGDHRLNAAELYDPDAGSWTAVSNMIEARWDHTATLLADGTVLVAGDNRTAELYDPATGTWTALSEPTEFGNPRALLADGSVLMTDLHDPNAEPGSPQPPCTAAALYDPRTGSWTTASSMLRCGNDSSFTPLLDGTVLVAGGRDCNDDGVCVPTGAAELYVPAGVSPPPLRAFPPPPPPVFPSPTPEPTPFPPAPGPVPPNARSWKVTVDNQSSEPATLFVAEWDVSGMFRLVGSATPNVVPAGATVKVTFLFPADSVPDDGWIYVNPRPGEGGSLVGAADIGIPGKIVIGAEGQVGWVGPP